MRDKPESVIDLCAALPRGVTVDEGEPGGSRISLGSGSSFQELAEALSKGDTCAAASLREAASALRQAVLSMANRNTRNRATLGGNLGADKSCSSLIPLLLALGAEVEVVSHNAPRPRALPLEAWLVARRTSRGETLAAATGDEKSGAHAHDLVLRVIVPTDVAQRAAYRRWNRVSCDLSVIGAACAYRLDEGMIRDLRVALGGFDAQARRYPEIESLFEGMPLSATRSECGEIEKAAAQLLRPIDDARSSAAFKRLRGSQLIADALCDAGSEARS
jgi:Aerobic-type carbon monoxide dehydrogenase, middle subunit CoxM/CutM homologs